MPVYLEQSSVNLVKRQVLIKAFPCFATLTPAQSKEIAVHMREVHYAPQEKIVTENDLVDSIYIIVSGEAEVTRGALHQKKIVQVPVAALRAGEGIGLNDTGFYSTTGKRTATVTAVTEMLLLRLDLKDLYGFLKKNNLELSMYAASLQMLRMRFIKQSLPFSRLSHERLQWLADRVEEMTIPAGTILFSQGEQGDKCYLIRSGKVEIVTKDENGNERSLALLKPPVLFGEATLITHTPRNATARVVEDADLLVLRHEHLSELIESEGNVANMFMALMVDRSRPIQSPHVTIHHRTTTDGQELTILKNPDNGSYFKLSREGSFIWQQLNGKNTMQDITLNLAEQFDVFAPDIVAALISKLTKAGFISNVQIHEEARLGSQPLWVRAMVAVRRILEVRVAFGDSDKWVTNEYQKIRYLFTKPGQLFLAIFAVVGFISFVASTENVLLFFSYQHASLLLLLGLIPLSLMEALLHEFGHAFAVKACGREVHYIGVGWYWLSPIAFTDTSDMWLATRKPRMLVNLAGIYVDVLTAGLSALFIFLIPNPYVQGMLWLFALYTYIRGFHMLSPLQEMDGYYVLMDWVEKPKLRQAAVVWLVNKFPKAIRQPKLFRNHWPEVWYWIVCIVFLILVSVLTLIVQEFVFVVLGMKPSNPYFSLFIPLLVVAFSSLSIIADIRAHVE